MFEHRGLIHVAGLNLESALEAVIETEANDIEEIEDGKLEVGQQIHTRKSHFFPLTCPTHSYYLHPGIDENVQMV